MAYTPVVLTIAGSDSGGGAGIQADIRTFRALGVHGACAITSITSQNTREVAARYDLPPDVVVSQMETVLADLEVASAKTGMLANAAIAAAVAETLARYDIRRLVVDPVAVSSSGQTLLDAGGLEVVAEKLLPLSLVFTPNLAEASLLLGHEVIGRDGMEQAARLLKKLTPGCVVLKGGHLNAGGSEALDMFYDGSDLVELKAPRVATADSHGTGCVFSASIAARLALGETPLQAAVGAKRDITRALENALHIGGGSGPVDPVPEPGG